MGGDPQSVTTRELLDIREEQWRSDLSKVSLAAEVLGGIPSDDRAQALDCLGRVLRRAGSWEHVAELRRWPAVHVVVTTGVATDHYTAGTFWPFLHEALEEHQVAAVHGKQAFQSLWGRAFLDNLAALGLPTFADSEDAGTKYVGRILMHCGMPTLCLYDYFRLVGERRARRAGMDPETFVAWVAARAGRTQWPNVPKPVTRFLQHGGEYAVDVTSRVFDLLDAVGGGSDGADAGLPERFGEVAQDLHRQGKMQPAARRSAYLDDADGDERPRIILEPFGLGVVLRLPGAATVHGRSTEWIVDADDQRQRIPVRARLAGFEQSAPPTHVPLTRPVRAVTAALAGREALTTTVPVVDDAAPLLAFDENGELRSTGLPLPGRPVWLLFPGTPEKLVVEGERRVLTESPLPPGWAGWCLVLVDLEGARSVRVGADAVPRPVRSHASARVTLGEPVAGVRTVQGRPVYGKLPVVSLPADLQDADWEVVLLDDRNAVVAQWRSGASGTDPQALWDLVPRPLAGSYTVRVRGPWGRGTRRSFDVVETLTATYSPAWRRFEAGGLQPCSVRLGADEKVGPSQSALHLGSEDREVVVQAGDRELVVIPPHMSVAHQTETASIPASIRPLSLLQEDLTEDAGRLLLDIGTKAQPQLHYLVSGHPVQTIEPGAGRNGIYPFDLTRLTDTLGVHRRGRLALDADGTLIVADIRPRRLFSDIMLLGRAIELTEAVPVDGLTALVYATYAPWLPPASLPVVDGRVDLPAHLQDAGPLLVMIRIEDPWVPLEIPEWPAPGEAYLLEGFGHVRTDNPDLTRLSAFLAGDQSLPDDIREFRALWTTRGMLDKLGPAVRHDEVAERIDAVLNAHPREALTAVVDSRAEADRIPSMLIRSGLVWADLSDAHDDVPPVWTRRNAIAAALLSAADGAWSDDEADAAVEVCGDVAISILTGEDPTPRAGLLDLGAEKYDSVPDVRDQILREMALVPAGMLSEDARILAVMEYLKRRRDPRIEGLVRTAHTLVESCDKLLAHLRDPVAVAAVAARRPTDTERGWRVVPAISLTYAFGARHAARGNRGAATWLAKRHTDTWSNLAEVVPDMVTTDLILAELLVASRSTVADAGPDTEGTLE